MQQARDLGKLVSADLKRSLQHQKAVSKAWSAPCQLKMTVRSTRLNVLLPLFRAFVRVPLEYCVEAGRPYLVRDKKMLTQLQRVFTQCFDYLRHMPHEQMLMALACTPGKT